MTVKVGDIVYYNGKAQRVMVVMNRSNYVVFSESGTVAFPNLSVLFRRMLLIWSTVR